MRCGKRVAIGVCALGFQGLIGVPTAGAVTCSLDTNTHVLSVSRAGTSGGTLAISRVGDILRVAGMDCAKVGPLGDTQAADKVVIDMAGPGTEALLFAMAGGQFGPGFTNEANESDEIEFEVNNVTPDTVNQLGIFGTSAGETFTAGSSFLQSEFIFVQTMNLNADAEATGGRDNDVIIRGKPGELALIGQGGNDTLRADGTGVIFGRAADADVAFVGGAGADTVVGGNGNDSLTMESAPDEPDSFRGGAGNDLVSYSARMSNVAVRLNDLADDGTNCPGACEGDDIGADVEEVRTGSGNDRLIGGPGHQELSSGVGADVLRGGAGRDLLFGGDGTDDLGGGKGFDFASYASSFNGVLVTIDGDDDDGVPGEHDNVRTDVEGVYGTFTDDHLTGSTKANHLFGGGGDDELRGGAGDDLMDGGRTEFGPIFDGKDGSDEFFGGPGRDTVTETGHVGGMILSIDNLTNDLVNGDVTQGVDNIHRDVENVVGGAAGDLIRGSGLGNVLSGGRGNDKLRGLGGNDVLKGGAGNDKLNGGSGRDTCQLGPGTGTKTSCEV